MTSKKIVINKKNNKFILMILAFWVKKLLKYNINKLNLQ